MALEDTVAKYTVQIVQEGSTATAVNEFNNLRSAAQAAAGGTTTLTSGMSEMRSGSVLLQSSLREVSGAAILLGGTHFPQLGAAAMEVRASFTLMRSAVLLTGASMEVMIPIIGAIAVVVGSGIGIWSQYSSELAEAKNKAVELAEGLEKLPEILHKISEAQHAGQLSDSDAEKYRKMLSGETPLYTNDPRLTWGNARSATKQHQTLLEDLQSGQQPVTQNPDDRIIGGYQLPPDERNAYVSGLMQRGGNEDAKGNQVQIQAINAQKDLIEKMNVERLDGYAKERQEALDTYDKELEKLRQIAVIENTIADPKLRATALAGNTDARTEAGDATTQKLTEIDAKQNADLQKAYNEYLKEELAVENQIDEETRKIADAKVKSLDQVERKQDELLKLQDQVTLESLSGEAKQQEAIRQTVEEQTRKATALMQSLGYSDTEIAAMIAKIKAGSTEINSFSGQIKSHIMTIQDMEVSTAEQFSSGFANAFVDFVDGTKSAKEAFEQFAESFLQNIAKMLMEQAILSMLSNIGAGGADAGAGAGAGAGIFDSGMMLAARGGVFPRLMAGGGFAGLVSSATFLPRFNVIAGESGGEMLAALARPTFRSIGGLDAVVGNAGNNRLALTNADDLANGGGGNRGGVIHIQIDHTPETQARIVSAAVDQAEVRVATNMQRNTPLRQSVRKATTR